MQIILILIGLVLILFNIRFINDGDSTLLKKRLEKKNLNDLKTNGTDERMTSFSGILENEKTGITELDVRIGELRREFSETLIDLQKEIIELNDKVDLIIETQSSAETIDTIDITDTDLETKTVVDADFNLNGSNSGDIMKMFSANEVSATSEEESRTLSKSDQVGILLKKGYSIDEICEKLQIGRGEVLLIRKLYQ